ncbi:zinc-ribbon domain-containing protein [Candidatus Gracilibacteria bacterium]|nr:zinc-ribbon domain-containing protein [Candidatus Gracilibacteria bacterium]
MYCPDCGKKIPFYSKFCPSCGSVLRGEGKNVADKPKNIGGLFFTMLGFFVFLCILGILSTYVSQGWKMSTEESDQATGIVAVVVFMMILVSVAMEIIKRTLLVKHPISNTLRSVIVSGISFIIILFGFFGYINSGYDYAKKALPVIQDNFSDAVVAKIMGDYIMSGHSIKGDSMTKVKDSSKFSVDGLTALAVSSTPSRLVGYRQSIVDWANQVLAASKKTNTWKALPSHPADFRLRLSNGDAEELFTISIKNIKALKEFGDTAIKNNDRETMRYIAAKLLIQSHWLNGILHSSSTNIFANSENTAYAEYVPPSYENGLYVPGFDAGCVEIPGGPPCGGQVTQPKTTTQPKTQTPTTTNNTAPKKSTPSVSNKVETKEPEEIPPKPFTYEDITPRAVCIGTGGLSVGDHSTNVFCVADAVSSTNEIAASAIGFASGEKDAEANWQKAWENFDELIPESEVGIPPSWPTIEGGKPIDTSKGVTQDTTNMVNGKPATTQTVQVFSPLVQLFYDQCTARKGIVGGTGKVMDRIPTTEAGYRCEYKIDSPNYGKNVPCWDYLTYSGERYLGGNSGCPEYGLLPK